MTREMGKVLKEAGGDVQEAIDCTYYTAGEGRRLHGFHHSGRDARQVCDVRATARRALRIDYALEFPDGDSSWKLIPALVCGNTVVIETSRRHAAVHLQPGQRLRGSGHTAGSCKSGNRLWRDAGAAITNHPALAFDLVHRLD